MHPHPTYWNGLREIADLNGNQFCLIETDYPNNHDLWRDDWPFGGHTGAGISIPVEPSQSAVPFALRAAYMRTSLVRTHVRLPALVPNAAPAAVRPERSAPADRSNHDPDVPLGPNRSGRDHRTAGTRRGHRLRLVVLRVAPCVPVAPGSRRPEVRLTLDRALPRVSARR